MQCTQCGLWELAAGDLVCGWCGTSYLRFTVSLEPAELSGEDYPPPVELRVGNQSPVGALTLERIDTGRGWITLLRDQILPQAIAPGAQHTFLLDADTFAARSEREAVITVTARHAPEAGTASLRVLGSGADGK